MGGRWTIPYSEGLKGRASFVTLGINEGRRGSAGTAPTGFGEEGRDASFGRCNVDVELGPSKCRVCTSASSRGKEGKIISDRRLENDRGR